MLETLTPATTFDLTTLAAARAELGGAASVADAEILGLIRRASAACARECNRPHFAREQYRQRATGLGPVILARDLEPTIESIDAAGTALDVADWHLDGPLLIRNGFRCYGWQAAGPLTVTYSAGYELPAEVPGDLEQACLSTLRAWHFSRGRDPGIRSMSSEGIGMTQYATAPGEAGAIPQGVCGMLSPWRRFSGF